MRERTVLCFGDSNTHGTPPMAALGEIARHDRATRWPGVLQAGLGDGWHVIEEGLGGRTTAFDDPVEGASKNGLTVLPGVLDTHRPLDLVIVMLGTNDVKVRFPVTAEDIGLCMEKLVLTIKSSAAGPGGAAPKVLVICPTPVIPAGPLAEMFAEGDKRAQALPRHYARVAEATGVAFLDAGTLISVDPADGVHLSAVSHRILGEAVTQAVRDLFA